mmetsp:Transcript_28459/g.91106  ORF Transcript_28459/g.91106 Transcript_28459/m.91106 type:complete len:275 (+) Transcript_28459:260-1084(+)
MGPKIKGYRYADDGTHPARFRIGSDADKREAWRIREFLTDDIAERKVHYDTWVEEPRERTLSEEDAQRLRMLHVFSSRRWDLAYLSLLTFWCVLLAGSDWIPDQFTHYLVLPQLAMSFCALVPSVGAVFFRYLQNDWTNITALDESRNWGVFFVLALKSTARGMEAGKPPPTLKSCLLETLDNWKKVTLTLSLSLTLTLTRTLTLNPSGSRSSGRSSASSPPPAPRLAPAMTRSGPSAPRRASATRTTCRRWTRTGRTSGGASRARRLTSTPWT